MDEAFRKRGKADTRVDGGGVRVSRALPLHIFHLKRYNLQKPREGQKRGTRCQLHLSSQDAFSLSWFPVARSLFLSGRQQPVTFRLAISSVNRKGILPVFTSGGTCVCTTRATCLLTAMVFFAVWGGKAAADSTLHIYGWKVKKKKEWRTRENEYCRKGVSGQSNIAFRRNKK